MSGSWPISFEVQFKRDESRVTLVGDKAIDLSMVCRFGMKNQSHAVSALHDLIVLNCIKCGYHCRNLQVATHKFIFS